VIASSQKVGECKPLVRAEVASAAPPFLSPAHDALNAFFQFTDATGQG
jgi:hypothetical protein